MGTRKAAVRAFFLSFSVLAEDLEDLVWIPAHRAAYNYPSSVLKDHVPSSDSPGMRNACIHAGEMFIHITKKIESTISYQHRSQLRHPDASRLRKIPRGSILLDTNKKWGPNTSSSRAAILPWFHFL